MEKDKTFGGVTQVQELARKLRENKSSLHIARIPEKTREIFTAIANEEYCSDYGLLLKAMVDKFIDMDNRKIIEKIQNHEERLITLESKQEKPTIKTLNGKKIIKEVKDE